MEIKNRRSKAVSRGQTLDHCHHKNLLNPCEHNNFNLLFQLLAKLIKMEKALLLEGKALNHHSSQITSIRTDYKSMQMKPNTQLSSFILIHNSPFV